jgi:hypothetical protein
MFRSPKYTFTSKPLRNVRWVLLLIPPAAMVRAGIAVAIAAGGGVQLQAQQCDPVIVLAELFDSVTPPALPPGWSSTTWVTFDSGVPSPPADTLPNAAFVDDPATINDKQLLSPTLPITGGSMRVYFRNNFNFQDGFDGGVLEVSFDNGLTFQDILTAGGTFIAGGYNGGVSTCCGNPLAGRQAWTGSSGGFIQTTVNVPIRLGSNVILRWRMGSDNSVSGEGWRVDSVTIAVPCPTPPRFRPRPTPAPRP